MIHVELFLSQQHVVDSFEVAVLAGGLEVRLRTVHLPLAHHGLSQLLHELLPRVWLRRGRKLLRDADRFDVGVNIPA